MDTACIFKRIEKKYLLTEEQYTSLFERIGTHLRPDEFGRSTVLSLYLDTPDHRIIRSSIEAADYKEKLRLRSYGTAAADIEKPADPTNAETAQYTYTFAGWTPAIAEVTKDATYKATFNETLRKYTVTFVDEDGTVLKAATAYDYGTAAADIETPADPTKEATAQYT